MNLSSRLLTVGGRRLARCAVLAAGLAGVAVAVAAGAPAEQPYLIDGWQMEQGLPENIVNAIAQTPDGYLWCGTTRGLARFDGVRFTVFNLAKSPELVAGRIRQLLVDRSGTLWISTSEGTLIRYQKGKFTAFNPPPRVSAGRIFIRMAEDATGALWLTAEDGALLRFAAGEFTLMSAKWDATGKQIFHVQADFQGQLWVATRAGLSRLDVTKQVLVPALAGKSAQYQILCPSHSGGWWIQTAGRVRLWRDGQWLADAGERLWPADRAWPACLEDHAGQLWVGTLGDGLFRYSTNSPVARITQNNGLGSDLIRTLFEDAEGNLWVGTRAGGLNRVRPALFKNYTRNDGLASDQITALCEGANGELWVGTDGEGVNRLKDGVVTRFGPEQGLVGRHIRGLVFDHQGDLWVGTWPGGLFKFEKEQEQFVALTNYAGPNKAISSMFEDSHQRLWLGQRSPNLLTPLTNGVAAAPVQLPNPNPSGDIIALAEDTAGNLWIGTEAGGLFRWRDGECRRYTRADGLPGDSIRSLYADRDGTLWIGVMEGGLCRLKNDRFVTCSMRDGLEDNVINHIADDGQGWLWFSSFHGIFRVKKSELNDFADGRQAKVQCVTYGKSDGLPSLECQGGFQPAGCRTRAGQLWFPTVKGLGSVFPTNAFVHSVAPKVLIEEFHVDNELIAGGTNAAARGEVRIAPGPHRYEFRYTGLDFNAPNLVRFRTQLEGLETECVEAGDRRTANYNHLLPGEYQFRVIACNQAGVWNEVGASLRFAVLPHFWQTWWFQVGGFLCAAGGVGGGVLLASRRRYKRRLERLETQLSVEKERARIAQDIHDGVGANLTEIAWLAEVAEKEALRPEEVRTQTRKISGTARETVQLFDEIVWAVLPQNDTLTSLVEYLGRRVDEWFENSPTRCWFTAPRELPDCVVPAEVRHGFYLACKEALHNVNQHARAAEVRVQVTVADDATLRVDIEDNGCGFEAAAAVASGNGLRNLRERFEKLGGQFELQSQPGRGTKIHMAIRLHPPARQ